MAGSVNKVILVGNLGADPEVRNTQDGRPIVNLRIATSERWRDKNSGEQREKTEWHRVVIFSEGLCRVAEQYLRKGSTVYIEGQLQTRKWQDQSGTDRYTTEIVVNDFPKKLPRYYNRDGQAAPAQQQTPQRQPSQPIAQASGQDFMGGPSFDSFSEFSDDIPF